MRYFIAAVLVASGVLASFSMYTVYETDKAIVLRLGKLKSDSSGKVIVKEPGLNFKLPLVETVRSFDTRLHALDIKSSRITTAEKKDVLVDFFVQWRIDDLALFYKRTSGIIRRAESLLQEKANAELKIEFGRMTIKEVVSGERSELMARIQNATNENAKNMGVSVWDVRVKRIDLPDTVSGSVYNRMRAERERKANELRADGEKEAIYIRAAADRRRRIILAEAEKQGQLIRGAGDARAVEIYAETYNKDPRFFDFYRSLEAYTDSMRDKSDILVLKPDSEFFKFFHGTEAAGD